MGSRLRGNDGCGSDHEPPIQPHPALTGLAMKKASQSLRTHQPSPAYRHGVGLLRREVDGSEERESEHE